MDYNRFSLILVKTSRRSSLLTENLRFYSRFAHRHAGKYVHRGQTYLTASYSQLRVIFVIFLISRRDGENNGFLAGVPLLQPPSRVVSRSNSLPLPFRTPATQARGDGGLLFHFILSTIV